MSNLYKDAEDFVSAQKLDLAARNLQHLLKIQNEQATLETVVASLQQTVIDAHGNNPMDLCDMMTTQARLLDGLFHHYLDQSKGAYTKDDKIDKAMRAQQQTVRTALAWKKLKTENYIVRKLVKIYPRENFGAERTEQNAPLDR